MLVSNIRYAFVTKPFEKCVLDPLSEICNVKERILVLKIERIQKNGTTLSNILYIDLERY